MNEYPPFFEHFTMPGSLRLTVSKLQKWVIVIQIHIGGNDSESLFWIWGQKARVYFPHPVLTVASRTLYPSAVIHTQLRKWNPPDWGASILVSNPFAGLGGPLEKEMATRSSILAWRIPWTEEPGGYNLWGCKEWDMTKPTNTFKTYIVY